MPQPSIGQHAVQVSHEANLRSQEGYNIAANAATHVEAHVAATSQHLGIQVAALAALGTVVQETVGQQSNSEVRLTAIESHAATTSQLNEMQQSTASSLTAAASEIQQLTTHARTQDVSAGRMEAQMKLRQTKLDEASASAGQRIESVTNVVSESSRRTEWAVKNIQTELSKELAKCSDIQQQAVVAQNTAITEQCNANRTQFMDKLYEILESLKAKGTQDCASTALAARMMINEKSVVE